MYISPPPLPGVAARRVYNLPAMQSIFGQDRAVEIVEAALRGNRVHHAWIFHGPAGVGKFTTALRFARILLCHAPTTSTDGRPEACGRCDSCRLFGRPDAAHPDLHVITKELAGASDFRSLRTKKQMNIPIDLLRERMLGGEVETTYIEPAVAKTPLLNHGKVFIIDEAELLDVTGQNALLKTLEEPSPGTYIILVTTHEDELLPTIRSRCQRVPFAPLDDQLIGRWLNDHAQGGDLNQKQLQWVLAFAQGSLGRALLALAYRMDGWYETLEPMIAAVTAGRPAPGMGATMAELVEAFAQAWVKDHANASKDAANKAGVRYMLSLLGEHCRSRLRQVSAEAASMDIDEVDRRLAPYMAGIELIQQAEANLESNVSPPLLLDNLCVQWAVMSQPHLAGR